MFLIFNYTMISHQLYPHHCPINYACLTILSLLTVSLWSFENKRLVTLTKPALRNMRDSIHDNTYKATLRKSMFCPAPLVTNQMLP